MALERALGPRPRDPGELEGFVVAFLGERFLRVPEDPDRVRDRDLLPADPFDGLPCPREHLLRGLPQGVLEAPDDFVHLRQKLPRLRVPPRIRRQASGCDLVLRPRDVDVRTPEIQEPVLDPARFLREGLDLLEVLRLEPLRDKLLHVHGLADPDRVLDLFEELAGLDRVDVGHPRMRDDHLHGRAHDLPVAGLPGPLRGVAGLLDEPLRGGDLPGVHRLLRVLHVQVEVLRLRADLPEVLGVEGEGDEVLPDPTEDPRLADEVHRLLRERVGLREVPLLEGGRRGVHRLSRPGRLRTAALLLLHLPLRDLEGGLRLREPAGLPDRDAGQAGELLHVRVHARSQGLTGLGHDLAGLREVRPRLPGRFRLGLDRD